VERLNDSRILIEFEWRKGWDYPKLRFGSGSRASLLTLARNAPRQSNGVRISEKEINARNGYTTTAS
jgi:hypothetical protein